MITDIKKCVGLLSGGLDSLIAVRIMVELGMDITLLNYVSPFCTCTPKKSSCKSTVLSAAKKYNIPIKVISLGQAYIDMIKNPAHGYGKNMNPCLDCRIMMFRTAKDLMNEIGASFVFTGEVLGQRPMSQRRDTLHLIERESGLKGRLLRPLSAKLLPPTEPEIQGIVDRQQLLNISGRSRKQQMHFAKEYDVGDYPCPSGGCLLTEVNFANRIKDLFKHERSPTVHDTKLLRVGRHIRLSPDSKAIVGRDESENNQLEHMVKDGDYLFIPCEVKGPCVLVKGIISAKDIQTIGKITSRYCTVPLGQAVTVEYTKKGKNEKKGYISENPIDEDRLQNMLI